MPRAVAVWLLTWLVAGCRPIAGAAVQPDPRPDATPASRSAVESSQPAPAPAGKGIIFEEKSAFSHVRVRDEGPLRKLLFVRESGAEDLESAIDLRAPDRLALDYTRYMFASFLVRPEQERCLIIGLGGGGMLRFLNRHFPRVQVDAVEVDPVVARVARELFGVIERANARILVQDGYRVLFSAGPRYDAIYLDAYLAPGATTDDEGMSEDLKGETVFARARARLTPEGVLVLNLNAQSETERDLRQLRSVFPEVLVFRVPESENRVVVASQVAHKREELRRVGRALDAQGDRGFSFAALLAALED